MIEKINNHPTFLYSEEILDICRPLKKLNITYFAHVRITDKNKFSGISCNPVFTEHYLINKYYVSDIHMLDVNNVGSFIVWDAINFTGVGEKICIESGQLGIHNPFTIINKHPGFVDYFHFANDSIDKKINQIYLANIDLLNRFITYFKERVSQSTSLSQAYNIFFDMGTSNKIIMTPFGNDSIVHDKFNFLKSIGQHQDFDKFSTKDVVLSKRQNEILRLVVRGRTVKEIALILKLSPRTVGHYFEMIKIKFDAHSKSDVISKAINNDFIKYFS